MTNSANIVWPLPYLFDKIVNVILLFILNIVLFQSLCLTFCNLGIVLFLGVHLSFSIFGIMIFFSLLTGFWIFMFFSLHFLIVNSAFYASVFLDAFFLGPRFFHLFQHVIFFDVIMKLRKDILQISQVILFQEPMDILYFLIICLTRFMKDTLVTKY